MICNKCGAELPDDYAFCTKCGAKLAEPTDEIKEHSSTVKSDAPASTGVSHAENPSPAPQKTDGQIQAKLLPTYVILGVVSLVLFKFASLARYHSYGLATVFAVFAILCSIGFCTVGIIRFVKCLGKRSPVEIILFALGIIGCVYVFIASILVLS